MPAKGRGGQPGANALEIIQLRFPQHMGTDDRMRSAVGHAAASAKIQSRTAASWKRSKGWRGPWIDGRDCRSAMPQAPVQSKSAMTVIRSARWSFGKRRLGKMRTRQSSRVPIQERHARTSPTIRPTERKAEACREDEAKRRTPIAHWTPGSSDGARRLKGGQGAGWRTGVPLGRRE